MVLNATEPSLSPDAEPRRFFTIKASKPSARETLLSVYA